jgi:hypothetical protein
VLLEKGSPVTEQEKKRMDFLHSLPPGFDSHIWLAAKRLTPEWESEDTMQDHDPGLQVQLGSVPVQEAGGKVLVKEVSVAYACKDGVGRRLERVPHGAES